MKLISQIRALLGGGSVGDAPSSSRRPNSSYMRGGANATFARWRPTLRSSQSDISEAWDQAAARTIDAVHNSGWLTGAVEQAVANTVGTGLRLKAQPENNLFGMSDHDAREWVKLVERRWELWSSNPQECDISAHRTFGQMQAAVFMQWLATGEILAELLFKRRPWNINGTKVRLLSPTRLMRRSEPMQGLINGVYIDGDGMPVAYLAARDDKVFGISERRVPARDSLGCPRVIHIFTGPPETYRGISPMAPALQTIRQFDQLADATLMAAIVQSLFAATITSDEPTAEVMSGLLTEREQAEMSRDGISPIEAYTEMTAGFYDDANIDVGINGRIGHLFPGQALKFHTSEHPGAGYADFSKSLLREIARCLGMTYESATGDYQSATYASLGRGIAEVFEVTKMRRSSVLVPFCQPIYEAWLEEEIESGRIPFPGGSLGFLANRGAASRALWRGGSKPIAEELKLSKAHEVWKRLGVISPQMICADLGHDYEDVLAQEAEAKALRDEYGIEEPMLMPATGGAPSAPEDRDEDEDEKEGAE